MRKKARDDLSPAEISSGKRSIEIESLRVYVARGKTYVSRGPMRRLYREYKVYRFLSGKEEVERKLKELVVASSHSLFCRTVFVWIY